MSAVSVVVLGGIGFHEIATNGNTVSTTLRIIPDYYMLPCIKSIFDEAEISLFVKITIRMRIRAPK